MRLVRSISLLVAAAGCGSLLACGPVHSVTVGRGGPPPSGPPVVVDEGHGHGPPPWAPAHGYRRNHQRAYQHRDATVDLAFDSGLGVYVVVGLPNYYYWDGFYLRSKPVKGKKGKGHGHGKGRGHDRDGDQGEDD